jgi:hypothetical protein
MEVLVRRVAGAVVVAACAGAAATAVTIGGVPAAGDDAASVRLRGCVVDASYVPRAGAVILRSGDGRLIGRALTDRDGRFVVRVPVRQRIELALDVPDGVAMTVSVGVEDTVIDTCLQDDTD